MHAAAYLANATQRLRLASATGEGCDYVWAASWLELDRLVRQLPIEIVVVDPCHDGGIEVAPVERLRTCYPSLCVLLYMPFSPAVVDTLLRLGNVGVHRAVFLNHDDTRESLRRAVDEVMAGTLSERIVSRIFTRLGTAPRDVVEVFRIALRNVNRVRTALEWSDVVGTPHRSFYRLFRVHELPTPKTCLLWLRLMYAARVLEDPGYSLHDVVRRLGYATPSNFWQHVQDTLGLRPSELRYDVDFEILLEQFVSQHVEPAERGYG
jgi:AraC-like DNA-binding protein